MVQRWGFAPGRTIPIRGESCADPSPYPGITRRKRRPASPPALFAAPARFPESFSGKLSALFLLFLSGKPSLTSSRVKRPAAILGRILLALLFLGYYGGTTLFYHVHYEPGGAVVHSHPALGDQAGTSSHHHSRAAYQTIQQLSHILLLLFVAEVLLRVFRKAYARLLCPLPQQTATACLSLSPLRAPPAR